MVEKTEPSRKLVEEHMDSYGSYVHSNANIFMGLKRSVERELRESIRNIPLREFLVKSGSTGLAGAAYLVPTKINDILIATATVRDVVPLISAYIIDGWEGGDLTVDIVVKDSWKANDYGSGGEIPSGTPETVKATISPKAFGWNLAVNNEMLEDGNWNLVEWQVRTAGEIMGVKSSDLALTALIAAADGDGTLNSSATGDTAETKYTGGATADVHDAIQGVGLDKWVADTMVITSEAWQHSVSLTGVAAVLNGLTSHPPSSPEYHMKFQNIDVLLNNSNALHLATDAAGAFTVCKTIVFDRGNALLTGRKRWLAIENYSKPVEDLVGATVTSRQDSVTLHKDAIYVLTETA